MPEIILMFAIVSLLAVYVASKSTLSRFGRRTGDSASFSSHIDPENFYSNQFMLQLRQEIEISLFPQPTDSMLRRHYETLVAAKLEERLEMMPQ